MRAAAMPIRRSGRARLPANRDALLPFLVCNCDTPSTPTSTQRAPPPPARPRTANRESSAEASKSRACPQARRPRHAVTPAQSGLQLGRSSEQERSGNRPPNGQLAVTPMANESSFPRRRPAVRENSKDSQRRHPRVGGGPASAPHVVDIAAKNWTPECAGARRRAAVRENSKDPPPRHPRVGGGPAYAPHVVDIAAKSCIPDCAARAREDALLSGKTRKTPHLVTPA